MLFLSVYLQLLFIENYFSGEITSNFNWSTTLYALSVYIVVIMLTLLTQYHIMTEIKTRDVKFNKALVQYLKLLSITQQLLGPLPFLLQKRNFQRFFKKWILFQVVKFYMVPLISFYTFTFDLILLLVLFIHPFENTFLSKQFVRLNER